MDVVLYMQNITFRNYKAWFALHVIGDRTLYSTTRFIPSESRGG